MYIHRLELSGYKHFRLTNIEKISIDFTEQVQLILGTNGSGKSALFRELSPLPALGEHYKKNGYKYISLSHANNSYELRSNFPKQAGLHSFLKNGVELNEGSTLTAQKQLVYTEFGLDQDIFNLLIGVDKELFTEMNIAKRKEWFTRLSDVNYDYVISIFLKAKTKLRDITGALNIANKRLSIETATETGANDELHLREQLDSLSLRTASLYDRKKPIVNSRVKIEESINEIKNDIFNLSKAFYHTEKIKPIYFTQLTHDSITIALEEKKDKTVKLRTELNYLINNYNKLMAKLSKAEEHKELEALEEIRVINKENKELFNKLKTNYLDIEQTTDTNNKHFTTTVNEIDTLLRNHYPVESDLKENRIKDIETKKVTEEHSIILNKKLNEVNVKIEHQLSHLNTNIRTCPNCDFNIGESINNKLTEYNTQKIELENKLELNKVTLDKVNLSLSFYEEVVKRYREFIALLRTNNFLDKLTNEFIEQKVFFTSPNLIMTKLGLVEEEFILKRKIKMNDARNEKLLEFIDISKSVKTVSSVELKKEIEEISTKIDKLMIETNTNSSELKEDENYIKSYLKQISISDKVSKLLDSLTKQYNLLLDCNVNEIIQEEINYCRESIISISGTLDKLVRRNIVIEELKKEIESLTEQVEIYTLITKQLSPTEGIIADGLHGFINKFLNRMNNVIKSIWSYPFEIQKCEMLENTIELDYKFPIIINDDETDLVNDVGNGSRGMKEIINLAFKLTASSFLNVSKLPLYLDEFGITFDETHRPATTKCIKNLIDNGLYEQYFMISHYADSHEVFNHAEVLMLCDKNVKIDNPVLRYKINNHATFKRSLSDV